MIDAIRGASVPVNSLAALRMLEELLEEHGTNRLGDLDGCARREARAALWVLNAHMHGQLVEIDQQQEWKEIVEGRDQEVVDDRV